MDTIAQRINNQIALREEEATVFKTIKQLQEQGYQSDEARIATAIQAHKDEVASILVAKDTRIAELEVALAAATAPTEDTLV